MIMKIKKTIIFIIAFTLVTTSTYALWPIVGGIAYQATLRVATSLGFRTVIARGVLSRALAKSAIKNAVGGGGPSKISWSLITSAAMAGSTFYLVLDLLGIINEVENDPDVYQEVEKTWTDPSTGIKFKHRGYSSPSGESGLYESVSRVKLFRSSGHNQVSIENMSGNAWGQWHTWNYSTYKPDEGYWSHKTKRVLTNHTFTVVNAQLQELSVTEVKKEISDTALDQWLDDNADDVAALNPTLTIINPGTTAVNAGSATGGVMEEPKIDTQTGEVIDTQTMLDQGAQVDPDLGTFTPPPQPGDPFFDTSGYVLPETKTFEEVMQPYLEGEDVVGDFLRDFSISGTGVGQVSIPIPFGEGTAVMDFGQFDDLYETLRLIIIGFAYLYGIMIFFKGS